MTTSFEEVRSWAIDEAADWALEADGRERLASADPVARWALRVEAFEALLPIGLAAAGVAGDLGSAGLGGATKRRGWDRAVRMAGLRVLGLGGRTPRAPRAEVAFLSELATPSTIEPMLAVAAATRRGAAQPIAADPRAFRAWAAAGASPLAATLPWRDERRILRASRSAAAAAWTSIRERPPAISLGETDLSRAAMPRLERIVRRSAPWLAVERAALRRRLEALQPRWLVLASDQHRLGRVAVDVARDLGIRTIVLQHGLPQFELGFVPVVADMVATWSEASDEWFVDHGTPPDRLLRLGNPRLDALARIDRDAASRDVAARHRLDGGPRLLLALSPSDLERNLALVDMALAVLERRPAAALIVKLHPGDGRWQEVRRRVAAGSTGTRTRVARREPLYPLLAWADIVLLHRSTVAIEALATGTPVVVSSVGAASPEDALPPDLDLPHVADAAELTGHVEALADEGGRLRFAAARRGAVERICGPLDGRVAERIATYLGTD